MLVLLLCYEKIIELRLNSYILIPKTKKCIHFFEKIIFTEKKNISVNKKILCVNNEEILYFIRMSL
jgi:hypothetical protein